MPMMRVTVMIPHTELGPWWCKLEQAGFEIVDCKSPVLPKAAKSVGDQLLTAVNDADPGISKPKRQGTSNPDSCRAFVRAHTLTLPNGSETSRQVLIKAAVAAGHSEACANTAVQHACKYDGAIERIGHGQGRYIVRHPQALISETATPEELTDGQA